MAKITKIVPIKDDMDDRQKSMLVAMRKDEKKNLFGFMELSLPGFQEKYGLMPEDFSNKEFTLAFAKLNPLFISEYNFLMFSRNYAKELIDQARLFSVDKVERGYYISDQIIDEDIKCFKMTIESKTKDRIAYNKAVEAYKVRKYNEINSSERSK